MCAPAVCQTVTTVSHCERKHLTVPQYTSCAVAGHTLWLHCFGRAEFGYPEHEMFHHTAATIERYGPRWRHRCQQEAFNKVLKQLLDFHHFHCDKYVGFPLRAALVMQLAQLLLQLLAVDPPAFFIYFPQLR